MLHRSRSYGPIAALGAAIALAALLFAVGPATNGDAATAPGLDTASSYAVLGGSTVTNTGATTINGDVGVSPGSAVTGFPPGIVTGGTIHAADASANQAQSDVTIAYDALTDEPCTADLTGQDLGTLTLVEGVYCFDSSAQLTGQLTLDAQGNANAVFIFKIGSTLTTASNASVLVTNGGVDCNVFWQVGSSATLGTTTDFAGNILALTSITLTTGASISGRALARNGAVTMDTNDIGFLGCSVATATPTAVPTATAAPTVAPTPTPVGQTPAPTPVGQTPAPTPVPTPVGPTPSPTPVGQTPAPTPSPTPSLQTPTPTPASPTPAITPSPTSVAPSVSPTPPSETLTPSPTPTPRPGGPLPPAAPSPTPVLPGFPNTGGPPEQGSFPWTLLLLGLALSGLGGAALVVGRVALAPRDAERPR